MNETSAVIEVAGLSVTFNTPVGPMKAVEDISFSIGKGEVLCLVGESGSGKSVTSFSLIGLIEPGRITAGSICFAGLDLTKESSRKLDELRGNQISMVFQEPMTALNPIMRVGDQIAEVLTAHGVDRHSAAGKAIEFMGRVGIPDPSVRYRAYPGELSGGMRQRVMIALACISRPQLIIADEPTTALDVTVQAQILDLLVEMQAELGSAMLFVTHDLAVVAEIADTVAVMYAGQIVEQGAVGTILRAPKHPYTKALLGAVLDVDAKRQRGRRLSAIEGSPAGLLNRESGCRFRPRCGNAHERCHQGPPTIVNYDNGSVRCWLYAE